MSDKKSSSVAKLIGNKIFILLLTFSIAIIFISLAFNKNAKKVSTIQEQQSVELPVVTAEPDVAYEDVFVPESEPEEIVEETKEETISYRLPIAGGLQKEFSVEELLWNETMQDWRTHCGMDIEGVAASTPDEIHKMEIDPFTGLKGYQKKP